MAQPEMPPRSAPSWAPQTREPGVGQANKARGRFPEATSLTGMTATRDHTPVNEYCNVNYTIRRDTETRSMQ